METKYTPGPWRKAFNTPNGIVQVDDQLTICHVDPWRGEEVNQADISLIAAVPELLEACKLAEAYFTEAISTRDEVLGALQEALNKAKGGQ